MSDNALKNINSDKGSKDRQPLSDYEFDIDNENVEFISTNCVPLNLLYSGRVKGGIPKGHMSMISAPSQLGKSIVSLQVAKNAQKNGMLVVIIDTERAFKKSMATTMKLDTSKDKLRVYRESAIEKVESIVSKITEGLTLDECANILFVIDSWGTLVTSKAIKDSLTGNDVSDMTEAKKKNRLANICLNTGATFMIVNHVYDNTGGFGDPLVIPGGKRVAFNCESIVLGMSRAKDKNKTTKDIEGHFITAKTFKSRFSICESKLVYRIRNSGGLDPFYGILPDALESGFVEKPKPGKYTRPHIKDDKEWAEKNIYDIEFWGPVLKDTDFPQWLEEKYTFSDDNIIMDAEDEYTDILG
jgi:RecA/RadA recombinase